MEPSDRSWGITPVPDRLRTLSLLDVGLLWGNLGVSLLVLFTGTFLAGLGLQRALLATVVGAVLGTALLGLAGLIGFERRVPGMVLLRDPLGRRGSYAPTGLNVAQNLGWAVFELYVMSLAASALTDQLFGFEARWLWVLAFGALTTWLALAGPISFVRRYVRRFAVWAVAASLAYLVWWALDGADVGGLWSASGEGGITFWQGVDLTIAMAASWLPLAADYTRFSRSRRAAFWGTSAGYFVPLVLLYGLGVLLALSRGLAEPSAIFTAIAAGGAASALALLALTVDESDEPFANVYSAAVSLQNLLPWASQRALIVLVAGAATLGAGVVDILAYETFLLLLGSFFVPLFGVLAADFLLGAGRPVDVRWSGIAAWTAGFALFQWIHPIGPAWWVDQVARVPGAGDVTIGASLPSFALAFALFAGVRSAHAPVGHRRARRA
jgi:putative hydroxymethylpyrimidine transporter CytX